MALSAVDLAVLGIADRWAYQKAASAYASAGGTNVWTRIDATGDVPFENRVKGANATALDNALASMPWGDINEFGAVLADLHAYCTTDLALAGLDAWLTARKLRLDYKAAQIWLDRYGTNHISLANIAGDGDGGASAPGASLGTMTRGSAAAGMANIGSGASASPLLMRVTALGAAYLTVTPTLVRDDLTTVALSALTVAGTTGGGAVGDTYVLGKEAITGAAAAAQKAVSVAKTEAFKVGEKVLLIQWTGSAPNETWTAMEWGTVAAITTNTSITLADNLLHSYTTAGFAYPCFRGLSAGSNTGGTAGDAVAFYCAPERRLKL